MAVYSNYFLELEIGDEKKEEDNKEEENKEENTPAEDNNDTRAYEKYKKRFIKNRFIIV